MWGVQHDALPPHTPSGHDSFPAGLRMSLRTPPAGSGPGHDGTGDLAVTEAQRRRSLAYLQRSFAAGRITREEFERRMELVLLADTRRDLDEAFRGLVRVPLALQAIGRHPVYSPFPNMDADGRAGRALATVAHWSGPVTWVFGPAVVYTLSRRGSFARTEAAKAFNFNLQVTVVMVALVVAAHLTGLGFLPWVGWLLASVGNALAGIQSADGRPSSTPLSRVLPIRALGESTTEPPELGR